MARYFMHLRDSIDELLDPEGREFASMEALREAVLFSARDVIAGDIRNGVIDYRYRIDAEDEHGTIVYTSRSSTPSTSSPKPPEELHRSHADRNGLSPTGTTGRPKVALVTMAKLPYIASAPHSRPSQRSEEHTSELQSPVHLVCRLLLEKKKDPCCLHIILCLQF